MIDSAKLRRNIGVSLVQAEVCSRASLRPHSGWEAVFGTPPQRMGYFFISGATTPVGDFVANYAAKITLFLFENLQRKDDRS